MSWWQTRPDGRRRPTVWLVGGLALVLAWWFGAGRAEERPEPPRLSRIEPASRTPADEPDPPGGADWLTLLEQTLAKPPPEPAPPPGAVEPTRVALGPLPSLSHWPTEGETMAPESNAASQQGRLPAGESFRVWFLETVRTGHLPALVRFMVVDDVRFGGRTVLPRGVRLFGAVQGEMGDRLAVEVTQVQWPNGETSDCSGHVVDLTDGFAGVRAWVVPPPGWVQGLEVAEEAWAAAIGLLRERATENVRPVWAASGPNLRETVAEASARAAVAAGTQRAETWRQRYPNYLEIRPGTEARVVLLEPFVRADGAETLP